MLGNKIDKKIKMAILPRYRALVFWWLFQMFLLTAGLGTFWRLNIENIMDISLVFALVLSSVILRAFSAKRACVFCLTVPGHLGFHTGGVRVRGPLGVGGFPGLAPASAKRHSPARFY